MKTKLFILFAIVMGMVACGKNAGKAMEFVEKRVENYHPRPNQRTIDNIEKGYNYVTKCGNCNGNGWVYATNAYGQYLVNAYGQYITQPCRVCGGSGKRY